MAIPRSRCRCMARCRRGQICSTRFSKVMATRGTRQQQQRLLDYHGGFGNAQIGYRHDAASNQLTWGGAGSVVAHPHGVTFGQTVGGELRHRPGAGGRRRGGAKRQQCAHRLARLCRGALPDRLPEKCHYPRYGVDGRRHRRRPAGGRP